MHALASRGETRGLEFREFLFRELLCPPLVFGAFF